MLRRLLPFCLLALSACSGGTALLVPEADAAADAQSPVDAPAPGVAVTAAIAAASLADNCPSTGSAGVAAPCARLAADAGGARDEACGTPCRQTSLQINFTLSPVGAPVTPAPSRAVVVTRIRLLDAASDAQLDVLTPREPQRWTGSQYVTWDGTLSAYGDLRGSYKLSAPNWSAIGGGNVWSTYGRAFRLEVTIEVNGQTLVLRSGELMRAPEVVT